ncbi:hypothetical protein FPV67DRAFT_1665432 [Lyophyllum atratum]|nr:hypothetical protein FPV67DRAFT_1665432 [Lyophyllum atratum]
MVVARKTPVAPAPPASRSNSSQPLPRAAKTKTNSVQAVNSKTPPLPPVKKSKAPLVRKKIKRARSSYTQRLFLLLLSAFGVYAAVVCRTDFPRTSPVCRSLDAYRTHILEPYVVPPLQSLLHHAEPHLQPLKPYVAPLQPYVTSTVTFTRTHVVPRVTALVSFILQQYRAHVAPRLYWFFVTQYWNGIFKPIYLKGIHPTLESQTRPYRLYYRKFVVPFAQRAAVHAREFYTRLRPHVVHHLKEARRHLCVAYKTVKPHVVRAYIQARPHVVTLLDKAKTQACFVARKAGEARREFVDPHVRRIWEKVGESSSSPVVATSTPTPTEAAADEPTPDPSPVSSVLAEPIRTETTVSAAEPETPTPEPPVFVETVEVFEEAVIPPPSAPAPIAESPIPVSEPAAAKAASVVAASLHATELEDGDPVDDFLKDIGLDETGADIHNETPDASVTSSAEAEQVTDYGDPMPSPEERERITKEKRADITARHERWQTDLQALVKEVTNSVKGTLQDLRAKAGEEIQKWGKEGKGVVHEVETEADRLVQGVEGYLKGVEAKGAAVKEGEKEKWEKVLEKVEERLGDKVNDVQRDVHNWFVDVQAKEAAAVDAAAATVKAFAERAQGDIGLDYAWLDDVTYYDWQKYHDLMRAAENFTADAQALQAAVDPQGTNPLVDLLNELEAAVGEVVDGFAILVKGIKRRAEAPGGVFDTERPSEEEKKGKEVEKERKVSVSPVDPAPTPKIDVVMGRSKEEVEAMLKDVPVEERAGREEL